MAAKDLPAGVSAQELREYLEAHQGERTAELDRILGKNRNRSTSEGPKSS